MDHHQQHHSHQQHNQQQHHHQHQQNYRQEHHHHHQQQNYYNNNNSNVYNPRHNGVYYNNFNNTVLDRFQNQNNYYQKQRLVSLDGIQSGVPTLTTSTLTPTTLRNIEQTFIELTSDPPVSAPYQAGFVPPLAPFNFVDNNDNNSMGSSETTGSESSWHTPIIHEDSSMATTDNSSIATTINPNGSPSLPIATSTATVNNATSIIIPPSSTTTTAPPPTTTTSRRNLGGRRPARPTNLTPEEEEKRKVRRERNKLAAARCRKRRVDQTNELVERVDQLEKEKEGLKKKIEELNMLKEDLQLCLEAHRTHCRLNSAGAGDGGRASSPLDIKPTVLTEVYDSKCIKSEPIDPIVDSLDGPPSPKRIMLTSNNPIIPPLPNVSTISSTIASATSLLNTPTIITSPPPNSIRPSRPRTLDVPLTITPSQVLGLSSSKNVLDIAGVPITTPSSGVMFNFDSLMDGGTGLTPVTAPLMPNCSSQNKYPLELTTPTSEPSKLVSL